MAEPIEMPCVMMNRVNPRYHMLDRAEVLKRVYATDPPDHLLTR